MNNLLAMNSKVEKASHSVYCCCVDCMRQTGLMAVNAQTHLGRSSHLSTGLVDFTI